MWEKWESNCTVGGNVNLYSRHGEQYGDSLKTLGIKLPYDPVIPLLGIYPEKTIIGKDKCAPMFIVALCTIATMLKQLRCPLTDEWIKKCHTNIQWNTQFSSVAQSCPILFNPRNRSTQGLPVHHQLPEFTRLTSIESVMLSSHLILCRPLLLLPPTPHSIRVFFQ